MRDRKDWKALTFPIEEIQALSDQTQKYELSEQQIDVLLGLTQYLHWQTRWHTATEGLGLSPAQREWIEDFASQTEYRLMSPVRGCCEEIPDFGVVRVFDGIPQWSIDGETWVDLDLDPDGEITAPPPSPIEADDDDERKCIAATRAMLVLEAMYLQVFGAFAEAVIGTFTSLIKFLADLAPAIISADIAPFPLMVQIDTHTDDWDEDSFGEPVLSEEAKEALVCLLLEHASANADQTVTFDWEAVTDNVITDVGVNPGTAMFLLMSYIGPDGLNRAGSVGATSEADCDFCFAVPCEYEDGFTSGYGPQTLHFAESDLAGQAPDLGEWQASGGRTDAGCLTVTTVGADEGVSFVVDLGEVCDDVRFECWVKPTVSQLYWIASARVTVGTAFASYNNFVNGLTPNEWNRFTIPFDDSFGQFRYISFALYTVAGNGSFLVDDIKIEVEP